jgi:hypothetical protein
MHALLIADADAARRESGLIARLAVALTADGARVTGALPASIAGDASAVDFLALAARVIRYRAEGLPFTIRWRARDLLALAHDDASRGGEPAIDVVHAIGPECWGIALELARAAGALLAIDVFGIHQAAGAARLADRHDAGAILLAADRHVLDAISKHAPEVRVHLAPWGVHVPETLVRPKRSAEAGHARSVVISGPCRSGASVGPLLEGVRLAAEESPETLFFADLPTARASGFYREVQRLALSHRLTVIPDAELHRHVVLHADVFVIPEAPLQHRTLVLDVLASGLPVLTPACEAISYLVRGETCRVVGANTPEAWRQALLESLRDDEHSARLAASARAHIRVHHSAAAHASAVLAAYESALGRETIPLENPTPKRPHSRGAGS